MNPLLRSALVLATSALMLTLQASCARSPSASADSDPLLVAPNTGKPTPLTTCIATDCPPPWATCPGDGAGLCTTDTSRDIANCGACGNECPHQSPAHHATSVCSEGKCAIACDELSADCNHIQADGCEIYTGDDPLNCGGCGHACKTGEICWKGACGCPNGFAVCGTECRNLDADNQSCGSCDKKCVAPPGNDPEWICGPNVQPTSTGWSCQTGGCKMTCEALFGDCDGNLCANGCETDEHTDPLNCGGCGHACAAGQDCVDGTCICPAGTTRCGKRCVDVNVDPDNCGACGTGCPGAGGDGENGTPTCTGGRCGYLCYAGFADCDGRINNGCEVNIGTDPQHCGGCNTKCDASRGQPCVLGQCLTKPCQDGPGTF